MKPYLKYFVPIGLLTLFVYAFGTLRTREVRQERALVQSCLESKCPAGYAPTYQIQRIPQCFCEVGAYSEQK